MALYYTAIAAALRRCALRLSSLPSDNLRNGLQQVLLLPWLDQDTRSLLQEALGAV